MNEKIRTLDSPLENINVTSKAEAQNLCSEIFDPNPKIMFTQTADPNEKVNLKLGKTVITVINAFTLFQTAFGNNEKMKIKKNIFYSRSK